MVVAAQKYARPPRTPVAKLVVFAVSDLKKKNRSLVAAAIFDKWNDLFLERYIATASPPYLPAVTAPYLYLGIERGY